MKYWLITTALLVMAAACSPAAVPLKAAQAKPPAPAPQTAAPPPVEQPVPVPNQAMPAADQVGPVRILLIHYMGTLQPLGCCDPGKNERDEFVAIQNTSPTVQNLAGWKLANISKGYPSFTFPEYFPCVPFVPSTEDKYVASTGNYKDSPPETVDKVFSSNPDLLKAPSTWPKEIVWSSYAPVSPLDETPMTSMPGTEQGKLAPCAIYPGQILLIFTDEIHCSYGGLSFRWGSGDLWSNRSPETAALYDRSGREVSRKSYTTGR